MIKSLLPYLVTLVTKTLRISWRGAKIPERAVVMFWHGDMLVGWYSVRKHHPIALVSKSKDGDILAAVLSHWGYKLTRGSSKKSGMEALELAMKSMKELERETLVITPDGPRGPRHIYKRGAFIAACELGLPLVHLDIEYSSRKALRSWDHFEVPLPFSRVTINATLIDVTTFPLHGADEQRAWLEEFANKNRVLKSAIEFEAA